MVDHGAPDTTSVSAAEAGAAAAADLHGAIGWVVLGAAVLIASLRMDRLEQQHINPYTVPGLLPGLLGLVMIFLGLLLAVRSWQRGARLNAIQHAPIDRAAAGRIAIVIGLCVVFGVGLVGRGLPFWLAAALFVTVAIVTLQAPQRAAAARTLSLRDVIVAALIGLGAGAAITLIFQQLFLVRLP